MMHSPANKIYEAMEQSSPEDILRWAFATFGEHVEIASAFGAEGIVLLDIAAKVKPDLRVFTLDTGFLFPETLRLMEKIEARYGIAIERIKPQLTPAEQEIRYGPALWSRDPDACCNLRKIEPLRRKLSTLGAWITSIRRDQTAARASAAKVEWDAKFQLMKINPLADWSSDRVWNYIRENRLSYNPLHDRNYPSIGCTHCTRSVRPGEDPRAGRWAGFAKTECGLHAPSCPSDMVSGITALSDERATVLSAAVPGGWPAES